MTYNGIMNCIRCGKKIPHPDPSNSDYIIAPDTIVKELREILIALKHNKITLAKRAKGIVVEDDEYDAVEVFDVLTAQKQFGKDLVKVIAGTREKDIQKTGIICPDCYKPTDNVIWGIHKKL